MFKSLLFVNHAQGKLENSPVCNNTKRITYIGGVGWGGSSVVELCSSMHKALGLISRTTKEAIRIKYLEMNLTKAVQDL
jgi:hypothetical protein